MEKFSKKNLLILKVGANYHSLADGFRRNVNNLFITVDDMVRASVGAGDFREKTFFSV